MDLVLYNNFILLNISYVSKQLSPEKFELYGAILVREIKSDVIPRFNIFNIESSLNVKVVKSNFSFF